MAKHMAKPGEVRYDPFASSDAADIASQLPASSPDETMQFIIAADESRRLMAVREAARGPEMTAAGAKSDGEGDLFSAPIAGTAPTASAPRSAGSRAGAPVAIMHGAAAVRPSAAKMVAPGEDEASDVAAAPSEPAMGSEEAVGRSAAMMSVLVIISRITGFFRTWAQSWALGATVMSSCYTVANNLPNQLYELVMGGMLVTAFLPVYMSVEKKMGREGASAYASNLLSLVTILMGVLAVLAFVFAGQVVWTQSAGATEAFDTDLAVYFFRFFAITIVLYALSSVISGVLNAERDYLWSTAAPILNNIVTMFSFVGYAVLADANPSLAILILALGGSVSVLVQVLVQIPALLRHGVHLTLRIDIHDPHIKETLSIGVPTLLVTLESFVTVSVMNSSALSVVASGASIIYYSRLWYMLPYSVLAIPITTAMFTELSDSVARGDMDAYTEGVRSGVSKIAFMLVPFAMFLITFAPELVAVLGAGRFSAQDAALTVGYLQALSLALPFYGVNTYLQKVCSSLRRMKSFVWASLVGGVVQVAFCLGLTPVIGLPAVALSSMLFFVISDVLTFVFLHRALGHIGLGGIVAATLRSLALGLAGSLAGWAILRALEALVAPLSGSVVQAIGYCIAGGMPALMVTFGIAVALRLPEASFVSTLLRRR